MIVKPPFISPAPPMPATARPTINILDDVATPQRREPNSKRHRKSMYVNFRRVSIDMEEKEIMRQHTLELNCLYSLPVIGCIAELCCSYQFDIKHLGLKA
jgi:hypothetical protein